MIDKLPSNSSIFIDSNIFIYHFLGIAEAVEIYGIEPKKAVRYLKQNPELIPKLEKCETAINDITEFKVKILTLTVESIFQSRSIRKEYCLMTNDSLNLQVMKINGLNNMATNDSDFDRVDWLKVWKP